MLSGVEASNYRPSKPTLDSAQGEGRAIRNFLINSLFVNHVTKREMFTIENNREILF